MLEFFRRQSKPIMIAVAVVVILAFAFFDTQNPSGGPAGESPEATAFTIYGTDYSYRERGRLQSYYDLAYGLGLTSPNGRGNFADVLGFIVQRYQFNERTPSDFAFNLLVLREEMEKHGVRPTNIEAKAAFRQLPIFQNNGTFDGNMAERFQSVLGQRGFSDADVFEVLRDWLGYQKLQQIVAGNAVLQENLTKQLYASQFQTIKAATLPFPLDKYKKEASVTDEDIKKYYEENKDTFKSTPRRAVSYVFFPSPDVEKLNAEDTVKARNAYSAKVNDFGAAAAAQGAKLDEVAKKAEVEVKTLPLFAMDAPPEALKEEFILVADIFRNDPAARPVSDPVEGSKGYYFYSVTEVEEPKQQELAEVTEKIKEQLVTQKARELMTKAANDTRKKLEEALKGGKSFADAAKEAGLEAETLAEFSPANPPSGLSNGPQIAAESRVTPAGGFTKPLETENGLVLLHVISKELYKREEGAANRSEMARSIDGMMQNDVFRAWFEARRNGANENAEPLQRRELGV